MWNFHGGLGFWPQNFQDVQRSFVFSGISKGKVKNLKIPGAFSIQQCKKARTCVFYLILSGIPSNSEQKKTHKRTKETKNALKRNRKERKTYRQQRQQKEGEPQTRTY